MGTYLDLDRTLSPEQATLRREVHRFSEEVLRPASLELDRLADPEDVIKSGSIFWDVLRQYYEHGYHRRGLPEALGGVSLSAEEQFLVAEEFGWGSADFAIDFGVTGIPEKYFFNREGRVVRKFIGPVGEDRMREALDSILASQ